MNHFSLSIIIASFLLEPVLVSKIRRKRVLYGHEGYEGDRDNYDVFRYYVFLAKNEPAFILYKLKRDKVPRIEDLVCGGSLLTPSIVQTAAHCVGTRARVEVDDLGNNVAYFQPKNIWENPLYSYVGSNLITRMGNWLRPKTYVVHQSSRQITGTPMGVMFDVGLIVTESKITERAPLAALSYAPIYPYVSIQAFYQTVIVHEYTCLHIGHGHWKVLSGEDGPYVERTPSDTIRWGWRTVMNQLDCAGVTCPLRCRRRFNYGRDATWVCSQTVNHNPRDRDYLYHTYAGDSGGPVTCNNVLFAVVSGGGSIQAHHVISYDTPVLYTPWENSADSRDDLIGYYSGVVWPNYDELVPTDHSLSKSPPNIPIINYLFLLSTFTCLNVFL